MAVELINVGQIANDGTGDDLREAFIKINQNFEELDLRDDEQTTASNIGSVGEGVFLQKINYDLQFKKLVAGQDVNLTSTGNTIVIDANGGLKTVLLIGDTGNKTLEGITHLNIVGGEDIATRIEQDTLFVDYTGAQGLIDDTAPTLSTVLNANAQNITNVNTIDAAQFVGSFTGNLEGRVNGIDIREVNSLLELNNFDMGQISLSITNIFQWVVADTEIDFGTFTSPEIKTIDLGVID